mgnify:CR=1 FL=1
MRHTCKMLYEETWDTCLACALERAHYMRTEYDREDAAWEGYHKEVLREITEIRNRENEANEMKMLRDLLKK